MAFYKPRVPFSYVSWNVKSLSRSWNTLGGSQYWPSHQAANQRECSSSVILGLFQLMSILISQCLEGPAVKYLNIISFHPFFFLQNIYSFFPFPVLWFHVLVQNSLSREPSSIELFLAVYSEHKLSENSIQILTPLLIHMRM